MTSIDYSTYNKKFYETKLLGKGNYAEVYEVVERASKRPYALKLIHFQKFDD